MKRVVLVVVGASIGVGVAVITQKPVVRQECTTRSPDGKLISLGVLSESECFTATAATRPRQPKK